MPRSIPMILPMFISETVSLTLAGVATDVVRAVS